MPRDVAELWGFIAGLDHASVMALFAHCAAQTVNALKLPWEQNKRHAHETANKLATAVDLNRTEKHRHHARHAATDRQLHERRCGTSQR